MGIFTTPEAELLTTLALHMLQVAIHVALFTAEIALGVGAPNDTFILISVVLAQPLPVGVFRSRAIL